MTIGKTVREPVQAAAEDRHDQQHQEQAKPHARRAGREVVESEKSHQRQRHETAEHEEVAVGEVDEFDNAVDHRVAQGDEGDDHPVGQSDDQLLQENLTARHIGVTLAVSSDCGNQKLIGRHLAT